MPLRPEVPNPSLLSPTAYDDDVSSLRSLSDQDSDSEDDELIQGTRDTLELAKHDRTVLEEEEEREKLLIRTSPTDGLRQIFGFRHDNGSSVRIGKRGRRRQRRMSIEPSGGWRRYAGEADVEGECLYEMEEGGFRDDSSSQLSIASSDPDVSKSNGRTYDKSRGLMYRRICLLSTGMVVLFLILFLGAYKASGHFRSSHRHRNLLSNGTSLFAPTTILISLDGFRADFLNRGLTPTLNTFIAEGISPKYMLPSFPSVTFPNHFTLVTGLYPESHGIVGNTFWDPKLQEDFYYTDPARSMQPKWWTAEPLWVTAENQGVRTAIHMWPGSEAHIPNVEPSFLDKYNSSEALPRKVSRILGLLDLPGEDDPSDGVARRPQFLAAYVPNIDVDGHAFGPNSTEIRRTIASVDKMIEDLFQGLRDRNLTNVVNVVVVSDHGMATTSTDRLIQLDDLIDLGLVDRIDGWPLRGLRPKHPEDLSTLHAQLTKSAEAYRDSIEFYSKESMPERYHFSSNERIAPLWVIPKTGWAIVEKADFDVEEAKKKKIRYRPKGLHGYDHEHPLMRAIFIAHGPSFPHKPNSRMENFQNIEVYNIVCDSLGIEPRPNNGTLRLPLRPVGLHSDDGAPPLDSPNDPPISSLPNPQSLSQSRPSATSSISAVSTPTADPNGSEKQEGSTSWWSTFLGEVESFKNWVHSLFGSPSK